MKKPVAVDLFAGAGGFSMGAALAGMRVAAALEMDPHAARTYRRNLVRRNGTRFVEDDILALDPRDFMLAVGLDAGECDILVGGPPCQGFSSHRINEAGVGDPRNRLLLRYFEYVRRLKPVFFLVENVPGLLWERHADFIRRFYAAARSSGYTVFEPALINARDHGVPQKRKRVFILGYDARRVRPPDWPPPATHVDPAARRPGDRRPGWLPASKVFERDVPRGDPNDVHMKHGDVLLAAFRNTPPNGGSRHQSGRALQCHQAHDGHSDVYGRIDPTRPGPTMTTACINPSKGRFVHPIEDHGITLRHAARFQTFPDTFVFEGGLMAGGVQVGNAVPVRLARNILRHLAEAVRTGRGVAETTPVAPRGRKV